MCRSSVRSRGSPVEAISEVLVPGFRNVMVGVGYSKTGTLVEPESCHALSILGVFPACHRVLRLGPRRTLPWNPTAARNGSKPKDPRIHKNPQNLKPARPARCGRQHQRPGQRRGGTWESHFYGERAPLKLHLQRFLTNPHTVFEGRSR